MDAIIVDTLLQLSAVVVLAASLAYLSYKIKQPMILAFVLVGFLLGPAVFDLITNHSTIVALSEIGIALLIYTVGAELDFKKLKAIKSNIIIIGIIQIAISFLGAFLLSKTMGLELLPSLIIGAILCISSTELVMKCLSDLKMTSSLKGRILLGILLLQDAIIIVFLPILTTSTGQFSFAIICELIYKLAIIIAVALVINFLVFRTVIKKSATNEDLLFLVILASCFGFILLSTVLNFSMIIAAFIGGLILANYPYQLEIMNRIKEIRMFFGMFFFILLGMQITGLGNINWVLIVILLIVTLLIKPISTYLAALFFKYDTGTSFFVSTSLFQQNIFGLVLVQAATVQGIFNTSISNTLILFIALTMILTPYVINYNKQIYEISNKVLFIDKISKAIRKVFKIKSTFIDQEKKLDFKDHIVIFGVGRMGTNIANSLLASRIVDKNKLVIVDSDPEPILQYIDLGVYAICGHADNKEILKNLDLDKAKLIITTIPQLEINKEILKQINPKKVKLLVRAHFLKDASEYYNLGAKFVVIPSILASNQIIKEVYNILQNKESNILNDLYKEYLDNKVLRGNCDE